LFIVEQRCIAVVVFMSTHAVEQMELQILADIYPVDQINIVFFFTVTQQ